MVMNKGPTFMTRRRMAEVIRRLSLGQGRDQVLSYLKTDEAMGDLQALRLVRRCAREMKEEWVQRELMAARARLVDARLAAARKRQADGDADGASLELDRVQQLLAMGYRAQQKQAG